MPAPLRPVAAAFVCFGMFWGTWAVSAADIERSLHMSHGEFGLYLSAALVAAAGANAVAGGLAERWGTRRALSAALVLWGALLAAAAAARPVPLLALAIAVTIPCAGAADVVMNIAATAALAERPGRLVRFHGFFNAGAAAGAVTAGVVLHAGLSWRWIWLVAAPVIWVLAAVCGRSPLPAGAAGERQSPLAALRTLRAERLVLLAIVFACAAMVEGGIDTWGVLYLRDRLAIGVLVGAAAYTTGQLVATTARVGLGPRVGRLGTSRGVALGAGTAAVGLAVLAIGHPVGLAAIGLIAGAGGISMCWPLLMAAAGTGRDRPANAVGGISSIGYLGFVVGPAVVGWLASTFGLPAGMTALVAGAAFVAATQPALGRRAAATRS